jgi:hypothetical protein
VQRGVHLLAWIEADGGLPFKALVFPIPGKIAGRPVALTERNAGRSRGINASV